VTWAGSRATLEGMTTDLVALARDVATRAHAGQVDKAGRPYIEHPTAVAGRLRTVDEQVVGFLHDVVEDTGVTLARLRSAGFTVEQVLSVDAVTKRRGETLEQSIARVVGDPSGVALRVKRADVSHNADPVRLGALDDEATRARLQEKYERTAVLLGTTLPAVLAEFGVAAE
jgi:(p)ppGpp synthase/HD superfamily hydrolase